MRWRFFIAEALRSIRSNMATTIAAVVTVLIVTFLLGVTLTVAKYVYDYTIGVRAQTTIKIYMAPGTEKNRARLNHIGNEVRALPYLKDMRYVSPADAVTMLSDKARQELKTLSYNPLPPAFYVHLTDPARAGLVSDRAKQIPEIAACPKQIQPCVTYGKEITERVLRVTKIILVFVGSLMALLGVAAVVLIANTIRLSIFARRREIEVMKLVGATNMFVRLPFVLEGMLTGLIGALGAIALLALTYAALNGQTTNVTGPVNSVGVPTLVALLASFGLVLGAVGSTVTLRRFLKV